VRPDPAVIVVVKIRTTDAARGHGDLHLTSFRRVDSELLNPQIFLGMDNNGFHEDSFSRVGVATSVTPINALTFPGITRR